MISENTTRADTFLCRRGLLLPSIQAPNRQILGVMPGFPGVGGPINLVALIFFILEVFPLNKEKPPMGGFSIASGI